MSDWTPEDERREAAADDRNAGCFLQGLGCAFDLLAAAIPFALAFVWLLS